MSWNVCAAVAGSFLDHVLPFLAEPMGKTVAQSNEVMVDLGVHSNGPNILQWRMSPIGT
jgi:hypothetical protein